MLGGGGDRLVGARWWNEKNRVGERQMGGGGLGWDGRAQGVGFGWEGEMGAGEGKGGGGQPGWGKTLFGKYVVTFRVGGRSRRGLGGGGVHARVGGGGGGGGY